MTSAEQHHMIQRLKSVVSKMTVEERRQYEMMVKRDRDDEDLDVLTMMKLKQLYATYFPKRTRQDIEDAWNKLSQKQ